VHAAVPVDKAIFPEAQAEHAPEAAPENVPIGQLVQPEVTPSWWYVPAAQSWQSSSASWLAAEEPVANLPLSHAEHAD
jgi:hypothetical protein